MSIPTFTLRCEIADVVGEEILNARITVSSTAAPDATVIGYPDGTVRPIGSNHVAPRGHLDLDLPLTTVAGANPSNHSWVISGIANLKATGEKPFGPIYVDRATAGTVTLSSFINTPPVEPTWRDDFRAEMEAIRDDAVAITGLPGADAAWAASIPTSSGSLTSAAITARLAQYSTTAQMGTAITTRLAPYSTTSQMTDAIATATAPPVLKTYTPSISGALSLGNGSVTGSYLEYPGGLVAWRAVVTFGSTTTMTAGRFVIFKPSTAAEVYSTDVIAIDSSAGYDYYDLSAVPDGFIYMRGTNGKAVNFSSTLPFTWTVDDVIIASGFYRKA